jgi:Ni,Fe-hydrogenase III small subunit/formate hydrogenlyase subunit 6/NADH:ubiquinone oxidoreductase subunit I
MFKIIQERLRQGHRTMAWPQGNLPPLPDRFRGLPVLDESRCVDGCSECVSVCPTVAISRASGLELDMGKCLFCNECVTACPTGAVRFTSEHRLAARNREDLIVRIGQAIELARPLEPKMLRLFGRSLKLRMVSAGGSNACEADVNVLGTIVFDLGGFGIQVVASPRHADGVVVIGPVSQNMKVALEKTYEATPAPKIVIAIGVCSISGGPFRDHPEVNNGCDGILPVDLYIPGFPPHPVTILDGLLRLLGRLEEIPDRTQPKALAR